MMLKMRKTTILHRISLLPPVPSQNTHSGICMPARLCCCIQPHHSQASCKYVCCSTSCRLRPHCTTTRCFRASGMYVCNNIRCHPLRSSCTWHTSVLSSSSPVPGQKPACTSPTQQRYKQFFLSSHPLRLYPLVSQNT